MEDIFKKAAYTSSPRFAEAVSAGDSSALARVLGMQAEHTTIDALPRIERDNITFVTGKYVTPETQGVFAVEVKAPGFVARAIAKVAGREAHARIRTTIR